MKKYLALLFVLSAVGGCGGDSDSESKGSERIWSSAYRNSFTGTCMDTLIDARKISNAQAAVYCGCLLEEAQSRWDQDYFDSRMVSCMDQLKSEGAEGACAKKATNISALSDEASGN